MSLDKTNKNYDSEFCGSIPLNFINSIQPHGLLIGVQKDSWKVIQVSENISQILNIAPKNILHQPFSAMLADNQLENIQARLKEWPVAERVPLNISLQSKEKTVHFSSVMHTYEQFYLIELLEVNEHEMNISFMEVYQKIKYISLALKDADSLKAIGEIAVEEIKKLSGFDKVMLYKFDRQWNGTVIAEARAEDMVSYLDLRFPASDIPRQSRELYLRNPHRLIPDTNFTPAKLVPVINPITHSFTDLSACNLRAVPKVHVEYLNNMGVEASMSVPIILHNQLWGLISCHHKTPKFPGVEILSAIELLATLISSSIASKETENSLKYKQKVDGLKINIFEQLYEKNDLISSISSNADNMLELFKADGLSLVLDDKIINTGNTPDDKQIQGIVKWLKRYQEEKVFTTQALPEIYEPAYAYKDISSGLMALNITHTHENYFLVYRPEVIQTVAWGGNPNEAINFEDDGKTYHPRNSFRVWKETVSHTSALWHKEEIEAADNLRIAMIEKLVKQ